VGTVIKANGDVDPLGVVSVLPLDLHREQACVQQVRAKLDPHPAGTVAAARLWHDTWPAQVLQYLARKCSDEAVKSKMKQACRDAPPA
jgi:hypothetical protein